MSGPASEYLIRNFATIKYTTSVKSATWQQQWRISAPSAVKNRSKFCFYVHLNLQRVGAVQMCGEGQLVAGESLPGLICMERGGEGRGGADF